MKNPKSLKDSVRPARLARLSKTAAFALPLLALSAVPASALVIDFTNSAEFGGAHGLPAYNRTVGGVSVTLESMPEESRLTWNAGDGIGIEYSYENDEIERAEILKISFASPTYVEALGLTDLFHERRSGRWYRELGWYQLDGGAPVWFEADFGRLPSPLSNGEKSLTIGQDVSAIYLSSPGRVQVKQRWQDHDFSLGSIEVRPVPEPGTFLLLAAGLLGFAAWRRRRA